MDTKSVSLFLAAVSLPAVLGATSANASCNDRPGTPTNVTADPSPPSTAPTIGVSWSNTANNDETVFWDVEVTDGHGRAVQDEPRPGAGRGDRGRGLRVSNTYSAPPGVTRCFRVKARTEPGTQGCVSEIWSNQACAATAVFPGAERLGSWGATHDSAPVGTGESSRSWPIWLKQH
jgi:hypothetical protein